MGAGAGPWADVSASGAEAVETGAAAASRVGGGALWAAGAAVHAAATPAAKPAAPNFKKSRREPDADPDPAGADRVPCDLGLVCSSNEPM
ncbi:MAG: hypothetical protein NVSMB2_20500 [Chloroflexota bacterium]